MNASVVFPAEGPPLDPPVHPVPDDLGSYPGTVFGSAEYCGRAGSGVRIVRHETGAGCAGEERCYTRPLWIAWTAPLTDGSATLLARQGRATRKRSRSILRRAADLTERIEAEVDAGTLREWKSVYDRQIASMPTGLNVIDIYSTLDNLAHLTFAGYFDATGMQAGVLFDTVTDPSTLRMRLAAATESGREAGLLRALYHRVADLGAAAGCTSMMMGLDPNLFGYVVQPGLCVFKLQMGFDPAPAQQYVDNPGYIDVTECIVAPVGNDASPLLFEYPAGHGHDNTLSLLGIRFGPPDTTPNDSGLVRRWIELPSRTTAVSPT